MKLYNKNPRIITEKQYKDLEIWLRELGDLSGIVHDLNSDEIVGGNQRSRIFDINQCKIELVQQFDLPDEQGTVAHGFVEWEGKRYAYRQVRWTPEQCEKANIIANKGGGEWDAEILANQFETQDLLDWGFRPFELGLIDGVNDPYNEYQGMPEYDTEGKGIRTIYIHFKSQEDIDKFSELMNQKITDKTKYLWYPPLSQDD